MTVNLSDCPCVCVCVCISPTLPHAPEAEHAAPDWVSSVIIYSTSKAICYLARCTAAPMAAELLSVLTFHHPRDSNRSAEKMYLPPYSSE